MIGASLDPEELNAEFREKEELEYDLVSDPAHELGSELGLIQEPGWILPIMGRSGTRSSTSEKVAIATPSVSFRAR